MEFAKYLFTAAFVIVSGGGVALWINNSFSLWGMVLPVLLAVPCIMAGVHYIKLERRAK